MALHTSFVRGITAAVFATGLLSVAAPTVARAQETDLLAIVTTASTFNTLTQLLQEANLTLTLRGPGPYTLLAPTDAAFAALPADTLEALRRNKARLRSVLLYHVIPGKFLAADLSQRSTVRTAEGSPLRITPMGAVIMLGSGHLTIMDRPASNGVLHTIDAVLLPPGR